MSNHPEINEDIANLICCTMGYAYKVKNLANELIDNYNNVSLDDEYREMYMLIPFYAKQFNFYYKKTIPEINHKTLEQLYIDVQIAIQEVMQLKPLYFCFENFYSEMYAEIAKDLQLESS
jgi:hypothetical protein